MKLPKKTLARIRKTKQKEDLARVERMQGIAHRWTRQVVASVNVSAVPKPDALATRNSVA